MNKFLIIALISVTCLSSCKAEDAQDVYSKVWDLVVEKKFDNALASLEKKIDPKDRGFSFYFLRGYASYCKNPFFNRREALNDFLIANTYYSANAMNLYMTGLCYEVIHQPDNALIYLNECSRYFNVNSGDMNPYTEIADIYYMKNELDLALEYLDKAELEEPDDSDIFMRRCLVYNKQGKRQECVEQYNKAISLESYPEYPLYLAASFLEIGDYKSAKPLFIDGITKHVQEAECTASLGYIAYMEGDEATAIKLMLDAFKMDCRDEVILQYLTYYYYAKRDTEKAITTYSMYLVFADDLDSGKVKDVYAEVEARFKDELTFIHFMKR